MLKNILAGIIALVIAFFVIGFLLPTEYRVERSIAINAPVAAVYSQVIDLKKSEAWNPWIRRDATMKLSYTDTSSGTGAAYSWTSENSGHGTMTVAKVEPLKRIETSLDFGDMGKSTGFWTFEADGEATRVVWGFSGSTGGDPIQAYFGLLMDSMAGPDFEQGLENLKQVVESTAEPRS